MAGGRRRRSRKMRGGNGYGFGAPIAVGALTVEPNMTSVPGGAPYTPTGGRRRRRGGAVDVDVPPVVGDIVADDGSKLFPEQQCVAAGRTWTAAPFGYTLTDAGNGQLGLGAEIADPKNDNGDPLGRCSGTSPPPNMGPTAPRAEEGGRRRRSRCRWKKSRTARVLASRWSSSSRYFTQFDLCQRCTSHIVKATTPPNIAIAVKAERPNLVMPV